MYVKPCRRCTLKDICSKRHRIASQLHALGIRSALIRCEEHDALFTIGDVVEIQLYQEQPYDEDTANMLTACEAVIVDLRQDKFWCWPLEGHTESVFITRYSDQLERLGKPPVDVCPECHKPRTEARDGWLCDTCAIPYLSETNKGERDTAITWASMVVV